MTRKRWLVELGWILAAPTLVLAAFAALTVAYNARAQSSPLRVAVTPQVAWPWQDAELHVTMGEKNGRPLPAVDMVFLVDISSSMTDSLPTMAKAVRSVAAAMPQGRGATRFALIRFDSRAETVVPWTDRSTDLAGGLDRLLPGFTGHTDAREAFDRLQIVLAAARPAAKRAVVWYTDGYLDSCPTATCPQGMSYDEVATAAAALATRGIEIYAVTPSHLFSTPHEVLTAMAGPERVFEPAADAGLLASFEQVAASALGSHRGTARLEQRLDFRHLAPLASVHDWRALGTDTLVLEMVLFPGRSSTAILSVDPRAMGWWSVGVEPALLTRADDAGRPVEQQADRSPRLLVLSWWTLLLIAAPAAVWGAFSWPRSTGRPPLRAELSPIPPRSAPAGLSPVAVRTASPLRTTPTLFLGIGGQGAATLEAVRAELDNLHQGQRGPHRFLAVDVDTRSPAPPAAPSAQPEVVRLTAPPTVTDVERYLPSPAHVPEAWRWLDAARYRDATREELDLAAGARGDRALGRLALFRWLAEGDLLEVLRGALAELVAQPGLPWPRQVVVVASAEGGFGSGTFVDWGRLVKRLCRAMQNDGGTDAVPEVIGLLVADPRQRRRQNLHALELELQSAQAAGALPTETIYGEAPALRRVDGEPAYHAVVEVAGETEAEAHDQGAQVAALLAEARARNALLSQLYTMGEDPDRSPVIRVHARTAQLFPAIERERRRLDVVSRCLGPDVLLDLQLAGETARPQPLTEQRLEQQLAVMASAEPAGGPLRLLLEACGANGDRRAAVDRAAERWPEDIGAWLGEALRANVERQLHGESTAGSWTRGLMPAEAAAVLRGLARKLGTLIGESGAAAAAAHALRKAAEGAAGALEGWLAEAAAGILRVASQREDLERWRQRLVDRAGRTAVQRSPVDDDAEIHRILAGWLGDVDTVAALREHLAIGLARDGDAWRVDVRDGLGDPRVHATWQAFEARLGELARELADSQPPLRLSKALAELGPLERAALARALVERHESPERVLVVAPATPPITSEERAVAEVVAAIPQPADHGGRRCEVESADDSAIRRLSLTRKPPMTTGATAPIAAAAPEHEAERVRLLLEREHRRTFPLLPVPLRIALAEPAAFRSFAAAYRGGLVVRRYDEAGRKQWYSLDAGRFLTFGDRSSLAEAAAGHASTAGHCNSPADPGEPSAARGEKGDFTALERWSAGGAAPDAEVLTLAAIRACGFSRGE